MKVELEFIEPLLDNSLEGLLKGWLDYSELRGLGQWRNASYGRFIWKEVS